MRACPVRSKEPLMRGAATQRQVANGRRKKNCLVIEKEAVNLLLLVRENVQPRVNIRPAGTGCWDGLPEAIVG